MIYSKGCSTPSVVALTIALALAGVPAAVPQCMTTCASVGSGMGCTVTIGMTTFPGPPSLACLPPLIPAGPTRFFVTMGMSAFCPPGGMGPGAPPPPITGIYHPPTAVTAPATCGFYVYIPCLDPAMPTTTFPGAMLTCFVDFMDGLPVELMEFSVEADDSAADADAGDTAAEESEPDPAADA